MEVKQILAGIVSLAICVVLVATVFVPAIGSATETTSTFSNEGYYYVEVAEDTHTLNYTNSTWTIDGEIWDKPALAAAVTLVATDVGEALRIDSNGVPTLSGSKVVASMTSMDMTLNSSTMSMTYTTSTVTEPTTTTIDYTEAYVISLDKADYVMSEYNGTVYVAGDSDVYAMGISGITMSSGSTWYSLVKIIGSIEEGFTCTISSAGYGDYAQYITINSITPVYEAVEGYEDLYTLTKIEVSVTASNEATGATGSNTWNYSAYIVPSDVIAEKSVHPSATVNSLISILPLIVMIALIIGAIGMFVSRRD